MVKQKENFPLSFLGQEQILVMNYSLFTWENQKGIFFKHSEIGKVYVMNDIFPWKNQKQITQTF